MFVYYCFACRRSAAAAATESAAAPPAAAAANQRRLAHPYLQAGSPSAMQTPEQLKAAGNAAFSAGRFAAACEQYSTAIALLDQQRSPGKELGVLYCNRWAAPPLQPCAVEAGCTGMQFTGMRCLIACLPTDACPVTHQPPAPTPPQSGRPAQAACLCGGAAGLRGSAGCAASLEQSAVPQGGGAPGAGADRCGCGGSKGSAGS